MIKVEVEENCYEIEKSLSVIEFARQYFPEKVEEFLACKVNHEVKSLTYQMDRNCKLEFLDYTTSDGNRIYVRGLTFILAKAFEELYPEVRLTVNYSLGHSLYCESLEGISITQEMLEKVEARMREIVQKDIPFVKKMMDIEEAKAIYEKNHRMDKVGVVENRMKSYVSMYYCEDTCNYFYGAMPLSTKYIQYFDITLYENGLLLVYPRRYNSKEIEKVKDTKKLYQTFCEYDRLYQILNVSNVASLNNCIKNNTIEDVIRVSEALHEKKIANIADKIAEDKRKKIVLIAGPSSSGKTTFTQRLEIQLKVNGIKAVMISVDNYFVERANNPKDENGNYDFECLEAIDLELFNQHLTALLRGEEIEVPTFDFLTGTRKYEGNKVKLHPGEVLLIEGIHGLNEKLTGSIPREAKFKIYISALTTLNIDDYNRVATTDLRMIRRMVRDHKFRSHKAIATIKMWPSVRNGEEKYIFPFQEEADAMFNSSLVYELGVLKTYAEPLLASIGPENPEYSEAKRLYEFLGYFLPIEAKSVPTNSLLREFIGDGCFYR